MRLRLSHTWLLFSLAGLVIFAAPLAHLAGVDGAMEPGVGILDLAVTGLFGLVTVSAGVLLYLRTEAYLND